MASRFCASHEGRVRGLTKAYEKVYYDLFMSGVGAPKKLVELLHLRNEVKEKKLKTHYLVTVSFPSDVIVQDMEKFASLIVERKWCSEWHYSFEFHNDKGEYHPHIHFIFRKTKPKSQLIREIFNTSQRTDYLAPPLVQSEHFIDVKPISLHDYDRTFAYICKDNPEDVEVREQYALENLYSFHKNAIDDYYADVETNDLI